MGKFLDVAIVVYTPLLVAYYINIMISLWLFQVKKRTANDNSVYGSHVMQYGDLNLNKEDLVLYMGTNPANDNYTFVDNNSLRLPSKAVNQRDADLVHFWDKVCLLHFISPILNFLYNLNVLSSRFRLRMKIVFHI